MCLTRHQVRLTLAGDHIECQMSYMYVIHTNVTITGFKAKYGFKS